MTSHHLDSTLNAAYLGRFYGSIPVAPWASPEVIEKAVRETRRALGGERGPLDPEGFALSLDACDKPGEVVV